MVLNEVHPPSAPPFPGQCTSYRIYFVTL